MIRSLYSGVTGLRTHQTKMDVIGNNVANVNTTAFKSSRVTFQDVYYQTVSNATPNTDTKGGVNAKQIGYGVTVSTIDVINTRGGIQSTDRPLDLYLSGEGYFIVQDGAGLVNYTRAGNFRFDVQGALVDANGNYVTGWIPTYQEGAAPDKLIIPDILNYTNITIGNDGTITGVYSGPTVPNIVAESLGLIKDILEVPGYTEVQYANGEITGLDSDGEMTVLYTDVQLDENGVLTGTPVSAADPLAVDLGSVGVDLSQYVGLTLEEDGTVLGITVQGNLHTTNEIEVLGQIAIANFSNPDALLQKDGIYFQESRNSGAPIITYPGNHATATIVSGGLEMSNVDLSKEFTDMITTQRGFQANSRLITTSDTLLEELVNLKR